MRLFPTLRYGTGGYPEKVARRLRALNLTAWIGSAVSTGFAVEQFLDPTPGLWKVGAVNLIGACIWASIPLLHRFGALVAPMALVLAIYAYFFAVIFLLGTGTGMQMYYLVGAALGLLFFGTEHILLASVFGGLAAFCIIALAVLVPITTGLQPATTQFANFVTTIFVSCGVLLAIVFYALREAARAEALAEYEHQRSESLLANILPATIADRLKSRTDAVIADRYDEASILFADMAGFTARTSDTRPDDLVQFLNRVFTDFDRLVERHGLEKIKTTGDSYMVVSGVPSPRADHAEALAQFALEIRDASRDLRDTRGRRVPIRIGFASGPVMAGVIGTRKFFYDVWGDAVNMASRMETTGEAGKIQVSQEVYVHLKDKFILEARGSIEIKGKGLVPTWFLVGPNEAVSHVTSAASRIGP